MKTKNNKHLVVSFRDHYRAQMILHSPKLNSLKANFYQYFKGQNLPIPENGFATTEEYNQWENSYLTLGVKKTHYDLIDEMLIKFGIP